MPPRKTRIPIPVPDAPTLKDFLRNARRAYREAHPSTHQKKPGRPSVRDIIFAACKDELDAIHDERGYDRATMEQTEQWSMGEGAAAFLRAAYNRRVTAVWRKAWRRFEPVTPTCPLCRWNHLPTALPTVFRLLNRLDKGNSKTIP